MLITTCRSPGRSGRRRFLSRGPRALEVLEQRNLLTGSFVAELADGLQVASIAAHEGLIYAGGTFNGQAGFTTVSEETGAAAGVTVLNTTDPDNNRGEVVHVAVVDNVVTFVGSGASPDTGIPEVNQSFVWAPDGSVTPLPFPDALLENRAFSANAEYALVMAGLPHVQPLDGEASFTVLPQDDVATGVSINDKATLVGGSDLGVPVIWSGSPETGYVKDDVVFPASIGAFSGTGVVGFAGNHFVVDGTDGNFKTGLGEVTADESIVSTLWESSGSASSSIISTELTSEIIVGFTDAGGVAQLSFDGATPVPFFDFVSSTLDLTASGITGFTEFSGVGSGLNTEVRETVTTATSSNGSQIVTTTTTEYLDASVLGTKSDGSEATFLARIELSSRLAGLSITLPTDFEPTDFESVMINESGATTTYIAGDRFDDPVFMSVTIDGNSIDVSDLTTLETPQPMSTTGDVLDVVVTDSGEILFVGFGQTPGSIVINSFQTLVWDLAGNATSVPFPIPEVASSLGSYGNDGFVVSQIGSGGPYVQSVDGLTNIPLIFEAGTNDFAAAASDDLSLIGGVRGQSNVVVLWELDTANKSATGVEVTSETGEVLTADGIGVRDIEGTEFVAQFRDTNSSSIGFGDAAVNSSVISIGRGIRPDLALSRAVRGDRYITFVDDPQDGPQTGIGGISEGNDAVAMIVVNDDAPIPFAEFATETTAANLVYPWAVSVSGTFEHPVAGQGNRFVTGDVVDAIVYGTDAVGEVGAFFTRTLIGKTVVGESRFDVNLPDGGGEFAVAESNGNLMLQLAAGTTVTEVTPHLGDPIRIDGSSEADALTLDLAVLDALGIDQIEFNGRGGFDTLTVTGGSFGTATIDYRNATDGTIQLDGMTIDFLGLEPVDMTGTTATDIVMNLPNGSVQAVLEPFAMGQLRLRSADDPVTFEETIFTVPTGTITINGGFGSDLIDASSAGAPVLINGRNGNDTLIGGSLADTLAGGTGNDRIGGGAGNDFLAGDTGADTLSGNAGSDTLDGSIGDDVLSGGSGRDVLNGGDGNDRLRGQGSTGDQLTGGLGNDKLDGGAGIDRVTEQGDVDFTATDSSLIGLGDDMLAAVERLTLLGGGGDNRIDTSAFSGDVNLSGLGGNDVLIAGSGNDQLRGGAGRDVLRGGPGNDHLKGQGGSGDELSGEAGNDTLNGGAGKDSFVETTSADFVLTDGQLVGNGTDILLAVEIAFLIGNASDNRIDAGGFSRSVVLNGLAGNDTLFGGSQNDQLRGGSGRDVLRGGAGNDVLFGQGGSGDNLRGDAGADTLDGGAGPDRIRRDEFDQVIDDVLDTVFDV